MLYNSFPYLLLKHHQSCQNNQKSTVKILEEWPQIGLTKQCQITAKDILWILGRCADSLKITQDEHQSIRSCHIGCWWSFVLTHSIPVKVSNHLGLNPNEQKLIRNVVYMTVLLSLNWCHYWCTFSPQSSHSHCTQCSKAGMEVTLLYHEIADWLKTKMVLSCLFQIVPWFRYPDVFRFDTTFAHLMNTHLIFSHEDSYKKISCNMYNIWSWGSVAFRKLW